MKNEILKMLIEKGGFENITGSDITPFFKKYGVTKTQNALDYFRYNPNGAAKLRRV